MKVILTAFRGKLKSGIMDFPEDTRPEIYMIMDMDSLKVNTLMEVTPSFDSVLKKAKFVATGRYYPQTKGDLATEYKLVDVS